MKKREIYKAKEVDEFFVVKYGDEFNITGYYSPDDWKLRTTSNETVEDYFTKIGEVSKWKMFLLIFGMLTINIDK